MLCHDEQVDKVRLRKAGMEHKPSLLVSKVFLTAGEQLLMRFKTQPRPVVKETI